jgi:hypothetical protein
MAVDIPPISDHVRGLWNQALVMNTKALEPYRGEYISQQAAATLGAGFIQAAATTFAALVQADLAEQIRTARENINAGS